MKGIEIVHDTNELHEVLPVHAANMCLGILYKRLANPRDLLGPHVTLSNNRRIPQAVWDLAYLAQTALPSDLQVPRERFTVRMEDFYDNLFTAWHYDGTNGADGPAVQFVDKGWAQVELARADYLLDDSLGDIKYGDTPEAWCTAYDSVVVEAGDALIFQPYFNPVAGLVAVHHRFDSDTSRHSFGLFGPMDTNEYAPRPTNWR